MGLAVPPERSARIHKGFHRIGAIAATIAFTLCAFFAWISGPVDRWEWIIGGAVIAALIYAASRAVGWIVAGFFGD